MPPVFDDHRAHLAALRAAALAAVDPAQAVQRWLTPADLEGAEEIYLVALGKAGVAMAQAAAERLGPRLTAGVAAVPSLPESPNTHERLTFIEGGHPQPTAGSLTAGRAVEALLSRVTPRDLVLVLISGGGSALLELPRPGITLADLKRTTAALLRSGATINEMNAVRSQLSQLKGGGLARMARPARVLALILSDVVGNLLATIASGPTVLDGVESGAALAVVERYGLRDELPEDVLQAVVHGTGPLEPSSPLVENRLIGSNRLAGEAAAGAAARLGFQVDWLGDDWQGEARLVGRRFARQLLAAAPGRGPARDEVRDLQAPSEPWPRCLVVGGESTVTVRGQGRGGRNQEAALAAALAIDGRPALAIGTFATDGVDGPTDAAGAVVTGETLPRARALDIDAEHYLNDNDSYTFFTRVGGLLITGPTGTNVNDLIFGLAY